MSIESVMPSNHLISVVSFSSCLRSFPSSGSFLTSQFFTSGGQSSGAPASGEVIKVIKNTKQDTRPILVHGFMVLVPSLGWHMPMLYHTAWSSFIGHIGRQQFFIHFQPGSCILRTWGYVPSAGASSRPLCCLSSWLLVPQLSRIRRYNSA